MYLRCLCGILVLLMGSAAPAQENASIYDLGLDELDKLRIASGASLTKTEAGKTPASVTLITREMIKEANARSLDELLEIYVPNLIRLEVAGGTGPKVGMRGILGGKNNKTLLLVNGRVMNQRTFYGAVSERFLPLFGDIESIEVVRGPGSSVYGPGAINGVISIRTSALSSSDGLEATFGQSIGEGYTLGEARYARTLGTRSSVFGYYGIDDYRGADPADSPLTFSKTKTLSNGTDLFIAGVAIDSGIACATTKRWTGSFITRRIWNTDTEIHRSGLGSSAAASTTCPLAAPSKAGGASRAVRVCGTSRSRCRESRGWS